MSKHVWACTEFKGHWPVGTSAVVVAANPLHAIELLEAELKRVGLEQKIEIKQLEVVASEYGATILQDGDY